MSGISGQISLLGRGLWEGRSAEHSGLRGGGASLIKIYFDLLGNEYKIITLKDVEYKGTNVTRQICRM